MIEISKTASNLTLSLLKMIILTPIPNSYQWVTHRALYWAQPCSSGRLMICPLCVCGKSDSFVYADDTVYFGVGGMSEEVLIKFTEAILAYHIWGEDTKCHRMQTRVTHKPKPPLQNPH